jgi:hypothetical protein
VVLCVALLALLAGCGGGAQEPENVPDTLGYVPRDAFFVMLVPTDLDGDQWRRFGHLVEPALRGSEFDTVRKNIAASIPDVDFDEELAPLLGETLVLAAFGARESPRTLAVLETHDADRAKSVADGIRNGDAIADGSTLVVELDGGNHELDAAVDRHEAGSGMNPDTFAKEFGDGAEDDALVRALQRGPYLQPLGPVRSAALEFRLDSDAIDLRVRARTDDPKRLARILEALGERGLHELPGTSARTGLVGDRFDFVDSDGRSGVTLVPLGTPTRRVETSDDVVDAEVTVPVPGGLD